MFRKAVRCSASRSCRIARSIADIFRRNRYAPGAFNIQVVKECAMEVSGKALCIRTIKQCRLTAVVSPVTCTELDVAVSLSPVEDGLEVTARISGGERVYMEYKGLMTVV